VLVTDVSMEHTLRGLEFVKMRKLWHDIQTHKRAALLFVVYWLATLAVIPITWTGGIPSPVVVLLLTTPLMAGVLVGWWRASTPECAAHWHRIKGGMLAGLLSTEITFLVMKGGAANEVIGWIQGHEFHGAEVLGFSMAAAVFGVFLGSAGAVLAIILDRFCHSIHLASRAEGSGR
jgi:hypothetical protein